MSYGLQQTRRFARAYKKLHDNVAADVDAATAPGLPTCHASERRPLLNPRQ